MLKNILVLLCIFIIAIFIFTCLTFSDGLAANKIVLLRSEYTDSLFQENTHWRNYDSLFIEPAKLLLNELPYQYDVVNDKFIEDDSLILKNYNLLIIPNAIAMSSYECSRIDEFIFKGGTALITGTSGVHNTHEWIDELGLGSAMGVYWPAAESREIYEAICWNLNIKLSGDQQYDAVFKGVFEKQRIWEKDITENDILIKNGWISPTVVPIYLTTAKLLAYWTDYLFDPPNKDPHGEEGRACALTCNKYGDGFAIFFNGKLFSGYKYCRELADWGAHRDTDACQNAEKIVFNVIRNFTDIPKSNLELASWWIQRQQHEKSGLVDSYEDGDRDSGHDLALLYDQALAVMAYDALADYEPLNSEMYKNRAYKILDSLQYLQQPDGSFYFSYNHKNGPITPANRNRYTNANAWLLMAINRYERRFNDPVTFRGMAMSLANWLCSQLDSCDTDCQMIRGGINAEDQAITWYSVESNLSAYAALDYFGDLTDNSNYTIAAQNIRQFIETHTWDDTEGRFLRGWKDPVAMMKVNPWAVLALDTESQKGYDFTRGLSWALQNCRTRHTWEGLWDSYNDSIGDIDGFDFNDDGDVVWVEGTESMALSLQLTGQGPLANNFHTEMAKLIPAANNGGLPYATTNEGTITDDKSRPLTYPSVAGTAWYIFKELNYNPFENPYPDTATKHLSRTDKVYASHYSLSQNYPNPFNSKTTITFGLPVPSDVEICIFNLSGRLIAEIFRGRKQAGYHSVSWNAGDNSSGTYFIKMVASDFSLIKKCVLLR